MGKRKSSKKPPPKKTSGKLDTTFNCLFCNHEKAVTVTLHRKEQIGEAKCKVCGLAHQMRTDALTAPIDVYSDWVDACEEVKAQ
ncbi:hypothetical protein PYCC9005_003214 [Savitreella phatthalungensis]